MHDDAIEVHKFRKKILGLRQIYVYFACLPGSLLKPNEIDYFLCFSNNYHVYVIDTD